LFEWISDVFLGAGTDRIVVAYLALGIEATRATARISALLVDASQMLSALRAYHTLGTTCGRSSKVATFATTCGMSFHSTTDAIGPAGIRFTYADGANRSTFTPHEGIALKATSATAGGHMIYHCTFGVRTTGTGARIAAMLLYAGQGRGTLRVVNTFWTTSGAVGISEIGLNATATGGIIVRSADRILRTGIRIARIKMIMWFCESQEIIVPYILEVHRARARRD